MVCQFPRKLAGAQAILFAQACAHYSENIEQHDLLSYERHPLFGWLSPFQRLELVREVMVGLLCENEPLPPATMQHYAAYLAMVAVIRVILSLERDGAFVDHPEMIGDDLEIKEVIKPRFWDIDVQERLQFAVHIDALTRRAETLKKKLDEIDLDSIPIFVAVEPEEMDVAAVTRQLDSYGLIREEDERPPPFTRTLNDHEEIAYRWRRMLYAALMEDNTHPYPLSKLTFDWRSENTMRWERALDILMITYFEMDGITPTEKALVDGAVGLRYADPTQHLRIQTLKRKVRDLRETYDPHWDPSKLSLDQRCIFSLSAISLNSSESQWPYLDDFADKLEARGSAVTDQSNFQVRYDTFNSMQMSNLHPEGLAEPFYSAPRIASHAFSNRTVPAMYQSHDMAGSSLVPKCRNSLEKHTRSFIECYMNKTRMLCSGCKTVSYCSSECQSLDWKRHKKDCKELNALRKDEGRLNELAKSFKLYDDA
jgi:hypothetical protein